jgi:hypothetical protein
VTRWLVAIAVLTFITLCYIGACAYIPFGNCFACRGTTCRRCEGTGKRVRLGRRLHTWLKHEHRNSR